MARKLVEEKEDTSAQIKAVMKEFDHKHRVLRGSKLRTFVAIGLVNATDGTTVEKLREAFAPLVPESNEDVGKILKEFASKRNGYASFKEGRYNGTEKLTDDLERTGTVLEVFITPPVMPLLRER